MKKQCLVINPQHGLCNRLRAIGSAYSIAKANNYKLYIHWIRDEHINCEIEDIIKNIDELATVVHTINLENFVIYNYMEIEGGKQERIYLSSNKIYCKSSSTLQHLDAFNYLKEFTERICYPKHVYELVNSIDVSHCIGLHIRTIDYGRSYENQYQNWTNKENEVMNYHRERSDCQQFMNQINMILQKNNHATFFVCSNEKNVINKLIRFYGKNRIITLHRNSYDRGLDNVIYAIADILLLSCCESFYGSYWSSYSEFVCTLRNNRNSIYSNTFLCNKDIINNALQTNVNCEKIQNGNTILTACMNRLDNLMVSLKSWLEIDDIDEIVIVDWGSTIPINIDTDSKKVKVYRVDNVDSWCLTKAYNFGIKCCAFTNIYKLDCETIVKNKNFIARYPLNNNKFYRGNWEKVNETNDLQINGTLFCTRENLVKCNGYNENITTYGWDDDDIYERLDFLQRIDIDPFDFQFIQHDDESRATNIDTCWNRIHSTQFNRIMTTKDQKYLSWNVKCLQSTFSEIKPRVFILNSSYNIDYKIIRDNFTETIDFVNQNYN